MSRKMRRTRDSQTSNEEGGLSSYQLYQMQGDSAAALASFKKDKPTFATKYNATILEYLTFQKSDVLPQLKSLEKEFQEKSNKTDHTISARKRKRNELILAYNQALVFLSKGDQNECLKICINKVGSLIENQTKMNEDQALVASRMALLMLEALLCLSMGSANEALCKSLGAPTMAKTLSWLDAFDTEKDPQLKFLISLYKSRLDLSQLENDKHSDAKIRSARKEIKSAMEVFQHRLRSSFGDTASVVSSTNSEENSTTNNDQGSGQQQVINSIVLQKHNQAALTLKAHLEQLKANSKKSLILCSEALNSSESDSAYEAIHSNNLAIIYQANDKKQLALHALAKGINSSQNAPHFHVDGTARPDCTLMLLYNSAICALKAGNFMSAYECMATCIVQSEYFGNQAQCWLRLAEACIGLFSKLPNKDDNIITPVVIKGQRRGALLDTALCAHNPGLLDETLVQVIGSLEDFDQVKRNPILRAISSLEKVLSFSDLGMDTNQAAQLALAYAYLVRKEYEAALKAAKTVIDTPSDRKSSSIKATIAIRRVATARMYAAEAACGLGDSGQAMKFLVQDGGDDTLDQLASDLSGVTIQTASENGKGKRRLARAQAMVRSSASVVTAASGNITAAKKLAMSAQAMEDANANNRERSSARRALVYSLLRDGNSAAAMKLLRAMRLN